MHKGDILPAEAFERLKANPQAVLVDVRTGPEWAYVGVPAVERLIRLSWQVYPSMQTNLDFAKEIEQAGLHQGHGIPVHLPLGRALGGRPPRR